MIISQPAFHQTLSITPVAVGNFIHGTMNGWLAPTLNSYHNSGKAFSLTDDDCSWMISLTYIGGILGCLLTAPLIDKYGRNVLITLAVFLRTMSWVGTALTMNIPLLLINRLLFGISVGLNSCTMAIYVSENSSPNLRGTFSSVNLAFNFAGLVVGGVLATYCSYEVATGICAGISLIGLASAILLKEPVQYLLMKGNEKAAEDRFLWLRGNSEDMQKEYLEIKENLAKEKIIFSFRFILDRRVQITCTLTTLAFLTGYLVLVSLVSMALEGTETFTSNELTILFVLAQWIAATISPLIIEKYSRRSLWMISSALCFAAHLIISVLFYTREIDIPVYGYAWLLFSSFILYSIVFAGLIYPLTITARGELLPQKYKAAGTCTSALINCAIGSLDGRAFLWISATFGKKANFIRFAISSLCLLSFCYIYLPETKDKSLVEIEKYFGNTKKNATDN